MNHSAVARLIEAKKQFWSAQKQFSIAGLGDSLTYGWMVERGYFQRCEEQLQTTYPDWTIQFFNAGVPGNVADEGLRRLPALLKRRPDIVLIQFGINDAYRRVQVADFARSVDEIATECVAGGCVPIVATSCPMANAADQQELAVYYAALLKVAAKIGCPVADTAGYWQRHASEGGQQLYLEDGVHPSDAGYALMARALFTVLDELVIRALPPHGKAPRP